MSVINIANSQIKWNANLEIGFQNINACQQYYNQYGRDYTVYNSPWLYTAQMDFIANWKIIYFQNKVNTYFNNFSFEQYSFDLHFVEYVTNIHLKYKSYELGFEHLCFHPIFVTGDEYRMQRTYDRFYLKIKII